MLISEPFTIFALSAGVITNLATDILKHKAQTIKNPRIAGWLKQLGLRELEFEERVQQLLIQAFTLYFDRYETYRIQGILEFFRTPEVALSVVNYVILGEPIDANQLNSLLEEFLDGKTISQLLIKKQKLDITMVMPDFLNCYHQVLNKQLNNSDMAVVAIVLRSHHETHAEITQVRKQLSAQQEQIKILQTDSDRQFAQQLKAINSLQLSEGSQLASFLSPLPSEDRPPNPPRIYTPRKNLVNFFLDKLSFVNWIAFVDGPGKGKTSLARDLAIASKLEMRWISIFGQDRSNPTAYLREQMVSWLVKISSDKSYWQQYIEGGLNLFDIVTKIAEHLSNMAILVVDDLPPPNFVGSLQLDLDIIAAVFSQARIKIFTTSQFPLPPTFLSKYQIIVTHIDPLDYEDFEHMLRCSNAPDFTFKPGFIGMLMADGITGSLPALASVTIDWLEQNNWKLDAEKLDAILRGEPAREEKQSGRNRILTLLDDTPKELLYRLSILTDPFDRELAIEIATIAPPIQYPGENFERLTSPWLEKRNDGEYHVTPYLRSSGRDNLDSMVQKQVHERVAKYLLRKGTVHVNQISKIAGHFYAAEMYPDYAAFLVDFMINNIRDSEQAKYADQMTFVSKLFVGTSWPESLGLDWRIMFRTGQVKMLLLAGKMQPN